MSDSKGGRPIIIKKIKKGHGGAHGGAWKLAYADYVTAMMAFFLLMWLINMTTPQQKVGLAEYFKDPSKVSLSGGSSTGDRTSLIPGGGESITRDAGHGKKSDTRNKQKEAEQLQQLKLEMEQMIKKEPQLKEFKDQFKVEITEEGLRVQIVDQEKRPMFGMASSHMESYASELIQNIALMINKLPNRVSITGHTDARPYTGGLAGYSNWELSSDRANAARQALVTGGLQEDKVMRVTGVGAGIPFNKLDPYDPSNRRISIIIMNKDSEDAALRSAQVQSSEGKGSAKSSKSNEGH